jgi:hypothetical protein
MESLLDIVAAAWQLTDIPGFDVEDLWESRQNTAIGVCCLLLLFHSHLAGFGRLIAPTEPIAAQFELIFRLLDPRIAGPSCHSPFHQSSSVFGHRSVQTLCLCSRINS